MDVLTLCEPEHVLEHLCWLLHDEGGSELRIGRDEIEAAHASRCRKPGGCALALTTECNHRRVLALATYCFLLSYQVPDIAEPKKRHLLRPVVVVVKDRFKVR